MAAAWDGPEGDHWAEHADRYEATSRALRAAAARRRRARVRTARSSTSAAARARRRSAPAASRARGSVLGVDLSSRMLAVGRAAAAAEQLDHVRFEQADAQVHPFEAAAFDVAISSFGAMFFADPGRRVHEHRARAAARRVARADRLARARSATSGSTRCARPSPPGATCPPRRPACPSPFSLADQAITTERLQAAGYDDIDFTSLAEPMCFGKDADDAYSFVSTFGITRGLTARPRRRDEDAPRSSCCTGRSRTTRHRTAWSSPAPPG